MATRRFERASFVQKVSHAIEAEEMAVTAENLAEFSEQTRVRVPERLLAVEETLNQPC